MNTRQDYKRRLMKTDLTRIFKSCEEADIYGIAHHLGISLYKPDDKGMPRLRHDFDSLLLEIQFTFNNLPKAERRALKKLLCQLRDYNKKEMKKNGEYKD